MSGFRVEVEGELLEFPAIACRLIAYLALQEQPKSRAYVAGALWPETSEHRAQGSLRSTLWRVRQVHEEIIMGSQACLSLADSVAVDAREVIEVAHWLSRGEPIGGPAPSSLDPFSAELLPDWYDDWIAIERERLRLMSLQALEDLAKVLTESGEYGQAVEAALAAVKLEPLRESARRALIGAHIAQGNYSEAIRQHDGYAQLLQTEMGVAPSCQMRTLIGQVYADESRRAG